MPDSLRPTDLAGGPLLDCKMEELRRAVQGYLPHADPQISKTREAPSTILETISGLCGVCSTGRPACQGGSEMESECSFSTKRNPGLYSGHEGQALTVGQLAGDLLHPRSKIVFGSLLLFAKFLGISAFWHPHSAATWKLSHTAIMPSPTPIFRKTIVGLGIPSIELWRRPYCPTPAFLVFRSVPDAESKFPSWELRDKLG
ncbi:hypothetical protein C8R44DRAFT_925139 [Mycena epipterygia]|nr:hypothetical protein C8R44DRAFT_925139 [Mycena epipterygia]